jgi:FKBP-type peptidyl-prolyl cis-trans isomerase SlyD
MEIRDNCIVSIHFTLTDDNGELLDQSKDGEPLVYLHGAAGIIPALESELTGKSAGDSFEATIAPDGGFGEHQAALLQQVPRGTVPDDVDLQVGIQIDIQGGDVGQQTGVVTAFDENSVTIDLNHPLAGLTLCFKGNIDDVREASDEEVKQWPNPVSPGDSGD